MKKYAFPLTLSAVCVVGANASWFSIQLLAEQERIAAVERHQWKLLKALDDYKAGFGTSFSALEYGPRAATSTEATEPTMLRFQASPGRPRK